MRNPLSKALWSVCLFVLGAALVLLAYATYALVSKPITAILVTIGMTSALIFLFTFLWALVSAIGYARLMSGKGVIARWHVIAEEWDRFRAFERRHRRRAWMSSSVGAPSSSIPHITASGGRPLLVVGSTG